MCGWFYSNRDFCTTFHKSLPFLVGGGGAETQDWRVFAIFLKLFGDLEFVFNLTFKQSRFAWIQSFATNFGFLDKMAGLL